MDPIPKYLISVTVGAILCSIATQLTGKNGSISTIIKVLTGIIMSTIIISPIISVSLENLYLYGDEISSEAQAAAHHGQAMAEAEIKEIIATQTQAYILKHAQQLGAKLDVQIILEDFIPASVRMVGSASPYTKTQLARYISETLGIPTEEQYWIE